jgi:hypothetical protein
MKNRFPSFLFFMGMSVLSISLLIARPNNLFSQQLNCWQCQSQCMGMTTLNGIHATCFSKFPYGTEYQSCVFRNCQINCINKGCTYGPNPTLKDCTSEECSLGTGQGGGICSNDCWNRGCASGQVCLDNQNYPYSVEKESCMTTNHATCSCKSPTCQ